MNLKRKVMAVVPILSVFAYLMLGFTVGGKAWAYGLLFFLTNPIVAILLGYKKFRVSVPVVVVVIYIILGVTIDWWHPGWLIFLLIPVIEILIRPTNNGRRKDKRMKYDEFIDIDDN